MIIVSPHDISDKFPETADIETASDDYDERFPGTVGAWMLKHQKTMEPGGSPRSLEDRRQKVVAFLGETTHPVPITVFR